MPAQLAGKVALVTGASRGLGRAVALERAGAGAHVVLTARSTRGHSRPRPVIHRPRSAGGQALCSSWSGSIRCRRCGEAIEQSSLGGRFASGDPDLDAGELERIIWWCPNCQGM